MENVKKHLQTAYKYISGLSVSGDAVDVVAMARMELREAVKLVDNMKQEEKTNGS